jgi:putative SOS response-associated peptidase YedK
LYDPHHRFERSRGRDPRPDPGHPSPGSYNAWLDPETQRDELDALLAPYPEDEMGAYPVIRFVNSPSNKDPRCVEPAV